jgi:hypothetical protein
VKALGKHQQPAQPITPEQLDAAAQVTPADLAAAREFWAYWGTPLLNAMLSAEAATNSLLEDTTP